MKPYYQRAGITLYCGDSLELLPRIKADIAITDPPYNAKKNYGPMVDDNRPWPEWCAWWDRYLALMLGSAPDVFSFLSQTAYKRYVRLGQIEVDWTLVWVKPLSLAVCAMPFMPHWEPIAYWGSTRKHHGAFWGSDVLTHNVETDGCGHPTPKPMPLIRDLVGRFDGVILDPFAGSGTTLRAAQEQGKQAIGIEINPAFCDMAVRRLEQWHKEPTEQMVMRLDLEAST